VALNCCNLQGLRLCAAEIGTSRLLEQPQELPIWASDRGGLQALIGGVALGERRLAGWLALWRFEGWRGCFSATNQFYQMANFVRHGELCPGPIWGMHQDMLGGRPHGSVRCNLQELVLVLQLAGNSAGRDFALCTSPCFFVCKTQRHQ
jgi:hypothetical protein